MPHLGGGELIIGALLIGGLILYIVIGTRPSRPPSNKKTIRLALRSIDVISAAALGFAAGLCIGAITGFPYISNGLTGIVAVAASAILTAIWGAISAFVSTLLLNLFLRLSKGLVVEFERADPTSQGQSGWPPTRLGNTPEREAELEAQRRG